jgi:hypothetical protein
LPDIAQDDSPIVDSALAVDLCADTAQGAHAVSLFGSLDFRDDGQLAV